MGYCVDPKNKPIVPRFSFGSSLGEQQVQLADNPLLQRFVESRQKLARDPFRPLYHFVSPECGLNDPNGLCFWHGHWHLFYQAFPPENSRPHWGHAYSRDLIHWQDLPYAIYPGSGNEAWSGSAFVEENRVLAMYYGHPIGALIESSEDPLLLNWSRLSQAPAIPLAAPIWTRLTALNTAQTGNPMGLPAGSINSVYDPCIWKKGTAYFALCGGTLPHHPSGNRQREEFLFRSYDLVTWEYLHPFLEGDIFGLPGDDGACPYFWPIGNKHILLHFSHMSGGKYMLGEYDQRNDTFIVERGGSFTFGSFDPGGVHAPTATPDGQGGVIALFNINVGKPTQGWDQIMSLPRRLTLADDGSLQIEPAGAIDSLREKHVSLSGLELPANQDVVLEAICGNAMELSLDIDLADSPMVEVNVLRSPNREEFTRIAFYKHRGHRNWDRGNGWDAESRDSLISIDTSYSSAAADTSCRAPETASVYIRKEEDLNLHIFLDKSVIEVFVNGRQCLALRVYPTRSDSLGVSVRSQGKPAILHRLDAWQLRSIY